MMINTKVGGATGLLEGSDEDCLQVHIRQPPQCTEILKINFTRSSSNPNAPQLNVYVPEASRGAEDPLPVMVQ